MAEMLRDKGRIVTGTQVQYRHPDYPFLIFHADGMFPKWSPLAPGATERSGPGVLEMKAPGSHMAEKMLEDGMSAHYVCQIQAGMMVASAATGQDFSWATAGFLDYNEWELVAFDVPASKEFQADALEKIIAFYESLQSDTPLEPIFPESLPDLPVINGTKEIITDGPIPALVEGLIGLMDGNHTPADYKMLSDAAKEKIKTAMGDIQLAEVPGLMRLSYGYGKPKEVVNDPMGLLGYCEHLVHKYNGDCANRDHEFDPITFRRSDWVDLKAPSRSFRPTRIDK